MNSDEKILTIANNFLGRNDVFKSLVNGKSIEIKPNDYEPKFSLHIDYNRHKNCIFVCLDVTNEGKFLDAFFYVDDLCYKNYPNLSRALVEIIKV